MADFIKAYDVVLAHEGGYSNDSLDPGGECYRGVARNIWSKWSGWVKVDLLRREANFPKNLDGELSLQEDIKDFYRVQFWDKISGDQIANQEVANSIFDFSVNCGVGTSASMAQMVVGVDHDGVIGNDSINAINNFNIDLFLASFTIAKIARYVGIVQKRPTSQKYFYGWVRRALGVN